MGLGFASQPCMGLEVGLVFPANPWLHASCVMRRFSSGLALSYGVVLLQAALNKAMANRIAFIT
jgi:hypothetical protein